MKVYAFLIAVLILAGGCATGHIGSSGGTTPSYSRATAKGITPLEDPDTTYTLASRAITRTSGGATAASGQERPAAPSSTTATASAAAPSDGMIEIPLYREELRVGKRVVPKGGVVLRKVVETETRSEPVELRREEIVIERVSAEEAQRLQANGTATYEASGAAPGADAGSGTSAGGAFQDREVLIELSREVPVVQKRATVTEVVRARKTLDTRSEVVSGTVRRESIDIDRAAAEGRPRAAKEGAPQQSTQASYAGSSARGEQGNAQGSSNGVRQPTREEGNSAELFLHQEELQVGKRVVPARQVVLRKNVTSEEVSRPVELREEDVRVERSPATGNEAAARENAFTPREIYIPLQQEVATVQKQVELIEVIRAGKKVDTEQQTVSGEVRSERVEVAETRSGRSNAGARNEASGTSAANEQESASGNEK